MKNKENKKKLIYYLKKYSPIYVFLLIGISSMIVAYHLGLLLLISLIFAVFVLFPMKYVWKKLEKWMENY